ncbi:MAG TPA: arginine--tRNA ligase [Acidimicrobiales bacterium]|nr:arginine--tRNA ligase [Acidimicrobiales bacterium]
MADPAHVLAERFRAAFAAALGPEHADTDAVIRPSAQSRFGDFQANAAMALGKTLGRPPREVAEAVVAALEVDDICSTVEIAGPGFVNLTLREEFVVACLPAAGDPRLGVEAAPVPRRAVVDYSAPNVAKEMHAGHLRSTIIGDALVRVLEFLGHPVVRQNHIGDWGTNFGMLIEHLVDLGEDEAAAELSVGDLDAFYKQARAKFESDAAFADRSRARVVTLQSGDEATLRMWRLLVDETMHYVNGVYERLGVLLTDDDLAGESLYNDMLAPTVDELETGGLAVVNEGALCVFPPGFLNRDGNPMPLIVRKRDGGFGYDATDLAAVRYRTRDLDGERLVYVVGADQSQHLAMVHRAGEMAGWLGAGDDTGDKTVRTAEHVAFGLVLGNDGKRFKSREGESVKLADLIDEAVERAARVVAEKNPDLDDDAKAAVAHAVGVGAIKYADLANDRVKDYTFDWDRMLAMEGNTAPYLQYAHARIRSIFRRAEVDPAVAETGAIVLAEPAERALALHLLGFDAAVRATADHLQPHRLATFLFEVASAFTSFYEACPVLRAESPDIRASRLALCALTARTLSTGLGLLGIETPDQM